MGTHQHSEELNDVSARVVSLLPDALEAFRREVYRTVRAHSDATGHNIQITDSLNGIAAYKLQYPAGAVRFRFSAEEQSAAMFALFRHSVEQAARSEMQLHANIVVQQRELRFAVDAEDRTMSPEDLAVRWLTWFFERI